MFSLLSSLFDFFHQSNISSLFAFLSGVNEQRETLSSQFNQQFTISFWANILLPKNYKAKL